MFGFLKTIIQNADLNRIQNAILGARMRRCTKRHMKKFYIYKVKEYIDNEM